MEQHVARMLESDYRWTEDRCIQLIRKFRSKSILWDTKTPLFYRQHIKKKVWDNIGRELNTTGADCKHKMSILLSSFRREKAKLRNSISTGTTPIYRSSWFAFNDLAFLMNRESQENISDPNEESGTDVSNSTSEIPTTNEESYILMEDDSNDYLKTEPLFDEDEELKRDLGIVAIDSASPVLTRDMTESDPMQYTVPENSGINKCRNIQRTTIKQTDTNRLEEILTFTNFIQAKLKKYSCQTLNTVQKEICDILFKADQNHYNNSTVSDDDQGLDSSKKKKLSEALTN